MSILQTPPWQVCSSQGEQYCHEVPKTGFIAVSYFWAVDTIANGPSRVNNPPKLSWAVDTIANGPSRVNHPPKLNHGGFTKPPIPNQTSCSDHHDRHKSRYGFCHVLSCLTVFMQCFCLVIFLISTIASFVNVISCNTITKRKCVNNKIAITS